MNTMTCEKIGHLMAIHSVTNKEIMEDITKDLAALRTADDIVRRVTMLDKAKDLSKSIMETQNRTCQFNLSAATGKQRKT